MLNTECRAKNNSYKTEYSEIAWGKKITPKNTECEFGQFSWQWEAQLEAQNGQLWRNCQQLREYWQYFITVGSYSCVKVYDKYDFNNR